MSLVHIGWSSTRCIAISSYYVHRYCPSIGGLGQHTVPESMYLQLQRVAHWVPGSVQLALWFAAALFIICWEPALRCMYAHTPSFQFSNVFCSNLVLLPSHHPFPELCERCFRWVIPPSWTVKVLCTLPLWFIVQFQFVSLRSNS
jgi:hypothetical protein